MSNTAQSVLPPAPSKSGWVLFAAIASGLMIILQFVRWPLTDLITPFIEPFVELAADGLFGIVFIACLVHAIRRRRTSRLQSLIPFIMCAVTTAILVFTPFNSLYLSANFHLLRHRRTSVAREVLAGQAGSLVSAGGRGNLIALSAKDSVLSAGGGEIMVDHRDGKTFVLFFTYRGILDRFSGYVYSPTDEPPAKDQFLGDGVEILRVAPNWYWYAS